MRLEARSQFGATRIQTRKKNFQADWIVSGLKTYVIEYIYLLYVGRIAELLILRYSGYAFWGSSSLVVHF